MFDVSSRVDSYSALLADNAKSSAIMAVLLIMGLVGGVLLWKLNSRMDQENTDEQSNRENTEIKVLLIIGVIVVLGGMIKCAVDLTQCVCDISNEEYIVVCDEFTITESQYFLPPRTDIIDITMEYIQNGERVAVDLDDTYCELEVGTYRDTIVVYSANSHIVVDVIRNN